MNITIKLFAADGTWQGDFCDDELTGAITEELERGGHAEVWEDGQRVFDVPAATLKQLTEQLTETKAAR